MRPMPQESTGKLVATCLKLKIFSRLFGPSADNGCWTRFGLRAEFMAWGSDKSILISASSPQLDNKFMCGNRVYCCHTVGLRVQGLHTNSVATVA